MIIHCRYEEYPTTPPLFVLNGFIYSLFGLYDLAQLGEGEMKVTAQKLYDEGMKSLKVMLPLFDSGKDNTSDGEQSTKMQTIHNGSNHHRAASVKLFGWKLQMD